MLAVLSSLAFLLVKRRRQASQKLLPSPYDPEAAMSGGDASSRSILSDPLLPGPPKQAYTEKGRELRQTLVVEQPDIMFRSTTRNLGLRPAYEVSTTRIPSHTSRPDPQPSQHSDAASFHSFSDTPLAAPGPRYSVHDGVRARGSGASRVERWAQSGRMDEDGESVAAHSPQSGSMLPPAYTQGARSIEIPGDQKMAR